MTFMSKVIFPLSFLSIGKLSVIMVTTCLKAISMKLLRKGPLEMIWKWRNKTKNWAEKNLVSTYINTHREKAKLEPKILGSCLLMTSVVGANFQLPRFQYARFTLVHGVEFE